MEIQYVLFTVFGRPVTLYALCIVLSLAAGLGLFAALQRKNGLNSGTAETFALLALPLGLLGARLFYCLCRLPLYLEMGLGGTLRLWEGGYALWGAFGGAAIAALLTARLTRQSAVRLLDALAVPGALTIALARFSEFANGEGIGLEVYNPVFQRFPFAVYNADWETWFYAIFILEGLAALAMALVLQCMKLKQPGSRAKAFLIFYCAAQILLESLRRDNFLRWLFVRVSQLTAVLVLGGMMFWALYRWVKAPRTERMAGSRLLISWVIFLVCVGVCIAMEFAVDKPMKSIVQVLVIGFLGLYGLYAGASAFLAGKSVKDRIVGGVTGLICIALAIIVVLLVDETGVMDIWLCYCIMTVCCAVLGYTAWQIIQKGVHTAE